MAEFVEVMRAARRMCEATGRPWQPIPCGYTFEQFEHVVMQWVAEHDTPTDEEKLYRQGYELGFSEGRLNALLEVRRMLGES